MTLSKIDDQALYLFNVGDLVLRVVSITVEIVGFLSRLFVIIHIAQFIKTTDKVFGDFAIFHKTISWYLCL